MLIGVPKFEQFLQERGQLYVEETGKYPFPTENGTTFRVTYRIRLDGNEIGMYIADGIEEKLTYQKYDGTLPHHDIQGYPENHWFSLCRRHGERIDVWAGTIPFE